MDGSLLEEVVFRVKAAGVEVGLPAAVGGALQLLSLYGRWNGGFLFNFWWSGCGILSCRRQQDEGRVCW